MADYVIQRGDTLSAIAQRLGTTVQALAQMNGISNPDLIRAGATLRVPDAPGATPAAAPQQAAARPATAPAPTTGAMPRPRPQQVAAMDPMAAPLPQPNPSRPAPPLPPQNPVRPGVPGPPMDRGAPMQVGGNIPGYMPAGGRVPPPPGPVPTTMQWTQNRPPMGSIGAPDGDPAMADIYGQQPMPPPGNGVGVPTVPVESGGPLPAAAPERLPDFVNMPQRDLERYMTAWVSAGRRLDELPPEFQMVWQFRMDEMRAGVERDQRTRQTEQQAYRDQWGTDPRIREPAPPVERSIREGEYLPNEMVQLGQLGSNMRNAPSAALGSLASGSPPPGANVIDGQYIPPQNATTLGQLAKRPWPFSTAPYYGV